MTGSPDSGGRLLPRTAPRRLVRRRGELAPLALLEDPTPSDPLKASTEILGKLAEQGILQQLGALGARLKSPDLPDGEAEDIMQQITELQRMRSEAKNP